MSEIKFGYDAIANVISSGSLAKGGKITTKLVFEIDSDVALSQYQIAYKPTNLLFKMSDPTIFIQL